MAALPERSGEYRDALIGDLSTRLASSPSIIERVNREETVSIGVAKYMHVPGVGHATHATIGLGEHDLAFKNGQPFPGGQELLALTTGTSSGMDKALAGAAFHVVKTGTVCAPGTAFVDLMGQAHPGVTVPHLFATDPFAWEQLGGGTEPFEFESRRIYWIMMIPISDGELELLRREGEEALCSALERSQADVADFWRASVA